MIAAQTLVEGLDGRCSIAQGFADWGEVLGDSVMATAILDRVLHHATTVNIKGELPAEGKTQGWPAGQVALCADLRFR